VSHTGLPAVRLGAAETDHVDLLTGDTAHDIGTGDEDPSIGRHDHDVGERRPVRRPAGRWAEYYRNLWHHTGCTDHGREDLADAVHRLDPTAELRAGGVPEPHHRVALARGQVDGVGDAQTLVDPERTALAGGVGAERDHLLAVDLPARDGRGDLVAFVQFGQRVQ
jgi:hypothetical protein